MRDSPEIDITAASCAHFANLRTLRETLWPDGPVRPARAPICPGRPHRSTSLPAACDCCGEHGSRSDARLPAVRTTLRLVGTVLPAHAALTACACGTTPCRMLCGSCAVPAMCRHAAPGSLPSCCIPLFPPYATVCARDEGGNALDPNIF